MLVGRRFAHSSAPLIQTMLIRATRVKGTPCSSPRLIHTRGPRLFLGRSGRSHKRDVSKNVLDRIWHGPPVRTNVLCLGCKQDLPMYLAMPTFYGQMTTPLILQNLLNEGTWVA
jgi:hypothetical protein